jgi:hypothetical protein
MRASSEVQAVERKEEAQAGDIAVTGRVVETDRRPAAILAGVAIAAVVGLQAAVPSSDQL